MPCRLQIKVNEARALPIMDKGSGSTDAYVEVKFANLAPQKTKIVNKKLDPVWKQSFQFEVQRDKHLQDAPVEFKVFDKDVVHDDIIGSVVVDITCLLKKRGPTQIAGWFPLYDSQRGIRGALNLSVKLEFVDNSHRYRDISASVKFFSISTALPKYKIAAIFGFVEELIVEDDPEYQSFTFNTSRTTNEQRRNILYHISGKLRRKIGNIVQDLGGNAVLGYRQHFDLEEASGKGIVARGFGTACLLAPIAQETSILEESTSPRSAKQICSSLEFSNPLNISVVDIPSASLQFIFTDQVHLLSLNTVPPIFSVQLGGMIAVRSVKILKKSHRRRNRDKWWSAIRNEIRSHATSLQCNTVFGYSESSTIEEDIVILSASGTACYVQDKEKRKKEKKKKKKKKKKLCFNNASHLPYESVSTKGIVCSKCKKAPVGEILLASIEPCSDLMIACHGLLLQARVCHPYKRKTGEGKESNAIAISEMIPFLEYDLHHQIRKKLRVLGANACFALSFQINLGESMITAVATGTAYLVEGLPYPKPLVGSPEIGKFSFWKFHSHVHEHEYSESEISQEIILEDHEDSASYSESSGSRFAVTVDNDPLDMEGLIDPPLPEGMHFCTSGRDPCNQDDYVLNSRFIVSFMKLRWEPPANNTNQQFSALFQRNLQKIIFDLCNSLPVSLCGVQFKISLPGENEIDFLITGMAMETSFVLPSPAIRPAGADEFIFELEPDEAEIKKAAMESMVLPSKRVKEKSPFLRASTDVIGHNDKSHAVIVTCLDYIPKCKIKKYMGRISHHLIRVNKEQKEIKEGGNMKSKKIGMLACTFLREAISVARSHVIGMGGDALIGFRIDSFNLAVQNDGYCLISFSGDAVLCRSKTKKSSTPSQSQSIP